MNYKVGDEVIIKCTAYEGPGVITCVHDDVRRRDGTDELPTWTATLDGGPTCIGRLASSMLRYKNGITAIKRRHNLGV